MPGDLNEYLNLPRERRFSPMDRQREQHMLNIKERRSSEREVMSDTILLRMVTDGAPRHFLSGIIKDISTGGILFESAAKLSKGDIVDVFFKRQLAYADTVARAEIVRIIDLGARQEIGARFL